MIDKIDVQPWSADSWEEEKGYNPASFHLDHARYIFPDGREMQVSIHGLSEDQNEALLLLDAKKADFSQLEQDGLAILHASRSSESEKTPGTWYWTEAQMQADKDDPDEEEEEEAETNPRAARKNEIILLGYELGKTQVQIKAQLHSEGFTDEWTEQFENGKKIISFREPEEYNFSLKFSGKTKGHGKAKKRRK